MGEETLKYSADHLWVAVEGDEARIGITDHAQKELADVVFVELPQTGAAFKRGDPFGSIESVKSVADLLAPLTGEVTAVNDELTNKPETINAAPYGEGWLVRIRFSKPEELGSLMDFEAYQKHSAQ